MLKGIIAVIVILGVAWGGWNIYEYWGKFKKKDESSDSSSATSSSRAAGAVDPSTLPGLNSRLEESLNASQRNGATGLRNWLAAHGKQTGDPRLAWIQLDYVVLVSRDDPAEAKRVFAQVKARTSNSSPVYPRVKSLEKTYE